MKLRTIALACTAALALLACNNGTNPVSQGPVATSVSGVAASGSPVVGTVVTVTDVNGNTATSTPTDVGGNFSVNVAALRPPFVLTAAFTDSDGQFGTLSSVVDGTGSIHANLNPLSSFITQQIFGNLSGAPTAAQITAKLNDSAITQATSAVMTPLQPLLAAFNVPATEANPITGTMVANASTDALDSLIDATHPIVHANSMVIGTGSSRYAASFASGASPSIPQAAIQSLQAQLAAGTSTPITNVIVVIGENQTFDGLFGGFQPNQGQTVQNLLSEGIIKADGTPGPNFKLAAQSQANIQTSYSINPSRASTYANLPQPFLTGILEPSFSYEPNAPDPRFAAPLPNGPFQITNYVPYATANSATGDPVHRFFQMWQQTGGNNAQHDMFVWPAVNVGQGGATTGITAQNPGQGGELMGFVNMSAANPDAQYFNYLAHTYAISDNYHQWLMGGTGMNFFAFATGDLPYFNVNGTPATPPANQIENPNPQAGTADFFANDGYEGGSYVNCADPTQPGVGTIQSFLQSVGSPTNCDPGKYYLVNNYSPAYDMNGNAQPIGPNNYNYPAQTVPTIAEALSAKGVSWKWYTGARNPADVTADAAAFGVPVAVAQAAQYNNLGDPLVASSKIMTNPKLKANLAGLTDFGNDLAKGTLPAVSFVVPKNLDSGHPGYSIVAKYEGFIQGLVSSVQQNPALWAHTAIIITTDEGGGHFDTGYIQNVDFFGDGPRIPLLVVSPYARNGAVDHTYNDHSSVLKFIERNWRLAPLSARSRDNLPNPIAVSSNPYKPVNTRAIGDLTSLFAF